MSDFLYNFISFRMHYSFYRDIFIPSVFAFFIQLQINTPNAYSYISFVDFSFLDRHNQAHRRGTSVHQLEHAVADAVSHEERAATHAEVRVEIREAHALRFTLEEGEVVGLEERGEELVEDALLAARLMVRVQAWACGVC